MRAEKISSFLDSPITKSQSKSPQQVRASKKTVQSSMEILKPQKDTLPALKKVGSDFNTTINPKSVFTRNAS